MIGVYAVDPGEHSGVAWAVVDPTARTVAEALVAREYDGSTTVTGDERGQIQVIYANWLHFKLNCLDLGIEYDHIYFAMEDFVLIPGQHSGGKEGIRPVHICWGTIGLQLGMSIMFWVMRGHPATHVTDIRLQLPGQASRYNTKERLGKAGCWVKAREHERSAWAHVWLCLTKVMK